MIKQIRGFWVAPENLPDLDTLSTLAYSYPARECVGQERETLGFRPFPTLGERQVVEVCGRRFLFAELQRFKRSVPASLVKRELKKRVDKILQSGGTVSKKEKAALKSDIEAEHLPKMPQADKLLPLVIDQERHLVWVGAASDGAADDVLGILRDGGVNLHQTPLFFEVQLGLHLTDWMLGNQPIPDGMVLGSKAKMAAAETPKPGVAISNEDLTDEDFVAVAKARQLMEIELVCDNLSYILVHDGSLKSIKVEAEGESFEDLIQEASYTLLEIANGLDGLIEHLGLKQPDTQPT